ncbi:MAG TPA: type I-C CRISPR-associated protein Cas8c/Csd1 [Bacillota bacterium]|nr:type I-C CRISPR-associated protein Cas8c/Csd1 [Bacillota bacterium]
MLKELVEQAEKLARQDELPPVGYSKYSEPIKWVVHLYPEEDRVYVEEYTENRPRPALSNRTSSSDLPYPFADEAVYVLGVEENNKGKIDLNAAKKHENYLKLLENMSQSPHFASPLYVEAIKYIYQKIKDGTIKEAFAGKKISSKDWVAFVYENGCLQNRYLHETPETTAFWAEYVSAKTRSSYNSECSICGRETEIVANIPTKVNLLGGRRQLASFNKDAFVSFRLKNKNVPLGICLSCAEKSAQALNYLLKSEYNNRTIYLDKTAKGKINYNSTRNQVAVYWLKDETTLSIAGQEYNLLDLLQAPLYLGDIQVETTEALIHGFLQSPWTGKDQSLNLDENTFYLVILSPNGTGRIAARDWIQVSAGRVKGNLCRYFEALRLVDVRGQKMRPYTIQELLAPLSDVDPNMAKDLLRSAYLGDIPPFSLFQAAIRRLRISSAKGSSQRKTDSRKEANEVLQKLCTIIKYYLTFDKEDAVIMEGLVMERSNPAYQCGRLLAVLEQIQRRAATTELLTTITERYYGAVSTSPKTVFPVLLSMATKAHLPKVRKNTRGYTELENLLEQIMTSIDCAGGFPATLFLNQQGEFALGFYHQRADLKARYANVKKPAVKNSESEQVDESNFSKEE